MKEFMAVLGIAVATTALIFVSPIFGVLLGAFVGYVVSLLATIWTTTGLKLIGVLVNPNELVELGAALGFVSGFFRSRLTVNKNDD